MAFGRWHCTDSCASGLRGVHAAGTITRQDTHSISSASQALGAGQRQALVAHYAPAGMQRRRHAACAGTAHFHDARARVEAVRHLCSNAAGAARPGTLGGRTTRLGTAVWRCAAAGAVCACDLGRTLMIFDAKGEESRHGDFRLVGISTLTIGKKTCEMDHISSPDNAPSNDIRAFRRLPAGFHSSQGTP